MWPYFSPASSASNSAIFFSSRPTLAGFALGHSFAGACAFNVCPSRKNPVARAYFISLRFMAHLPPTRRVCQSYLPVAALSAKNEYDFRATEPAASQRLEFGHTDLLRKRFLVNPRNELQCVLVVNLLQHLFRHLKTVNPPEGVAPAVILKIFVASFERAEIPFVFVHVVDVFAHQDAVLILI